jgi:GDP-L-fucose synthase
MPLITSSDRVYVAGHTGLVGSAIMEVLRARGFRNIVTRTIDELNLLDQTQVNAFFSSEKPTAVFLAAAKVGGIHANNTYRADFIYENLQIQNNVIWAAHTHQVHRLVFLGSSCIYPRDCVQPMKEEHLLTGSLEPTNRPYALAKIAGLELVSSLRQQFGRDYFSVMPTNLYGPRDNFHPVNSHVLPALIRRIHEATKSGAACVTVWGTGAPQREFMYSLDCANAIVHLASTLTSEQISQSPLGRLGWSHINIGTGQEVTIRELTATIARVIGFRGNIQFDHSKPDGSARKLLDTSLLQQLGFRPSMPLEEGIRSTYEHFLQTTP